MSGPRDPDRSLGFSGMDQKTFAAALLDPEAPPPPGLATVGGAAPVKRFAVYRNNVVASLVAALGQGYPTVRKLVGEAFFDAMAGVFVRAHPPTTPMMMVYGERFPDWVRTFPPAASLPYLADVAALELARREAYHATDAPPLTADAFRQLSAGLTPEAVGSVRFERHPAARIVRSRYPIFRIWAKNNDIAETKAAAGNVLIVRPAYTVSVWPLRSGEAAFFDAIFAGETLEASGARGGAADPTFDLGGALTTLLRSGAAQAARS